MCSSESFELVVMHAWCCISTAGSDYTSVTDYTLSFAAGSPVNSMSCVDIVILEDSAVEDIERFYVELSTSDPVNILSPDNASVSILDDDGRCIWCIYNSLSRKTCINCCGCPAPMQCGAYTYNYILSVDLSMAPFTASK